jgi:hypothetical protein
MKQGNEVHYLSAQEPAHDVGSIRFDVFLARLAQTHHTFITQNVYIIRNKAIVL